MILDNENNYCDRKSKCKNRIKNSIKGNRRTQAKNVAYYLWW